MILVAVGLVVAMAIGLWAAQRRLIYFPDGDIPPVSDVLPGWSEVTVTTADGLELEAWYSTPDSQQPVVVVFGGNAGNRANRATLGSRLAAEGLGVMLVDYRGYGGNPGRPSESALALDARAAVDFVERAAPGHPLVFLGESLGAAVAVELAASRPPAALILRSPFTSLADVARVHYPVIAVGFLLRDSYASSERIGAVRAPVLIIAGSEDTIVPMAQSRELYQLAAEPKELVVVPDADHNSSALVAGDEVIEAIVRFIDEATLR